MAKKKTIKKHGNMVSSKAVQSQMLLFGMSQSTWESELITPSEIPESLNFFLFNVRTYV